MVCRELKVVENAALDPGFSHVALFLMQNGAATPVCHS
jgi:hypothetical protein